MPEVYVATRREFLLKAQNPDGGWGYFPAKASWLEPTAYAMLALHGDAAADEAVGRAWRLLDAWQLSDGNWRAGAQVQEGAWGAALAVTLHAIRNQTTPALARGVDYLLRTEGAERCLTFRLMELFGLGKIDMDTSHPAWPWRQGTSSWIEPTAHSLVALKKAAKRVGDRRIGVRIGEGEEAILVRRCSDGGWNHGCPSTFHIDAPSYPESTALALLALQSRPREAASALKIARSQWSSTDSPLAKAWLAIALQVWGDRVPAPDYRPPARDCMIAALEMIAHPDGNHGLLRTEARV